MTNNKEVGSKYEELAANLLIDKGMKIIERNYRFKKMGEIDIIAKDGKEVVFVEVKYRKSDGYGGADYAVDYKKQRQIAKVANVYILTNNLSQNAFYRFDCIMITGNEINYCKNAFGGM